MLFYPPDAPVPDELRTDELFLRMLRATDVEPDYEAVISSRELLWLRSSGRWPREGFTLAENLSDLQEHEQEHHQRTAFTFTVLAPDEALCLGCIYINPLAAVMQRLGAAAADVARVGDYEADVTLWVRPSAVRRDLDKHLVSALIRWFKAEWAFSRVTFRANKNQVRDLANFEEAGLRQVYAITTNEEPYTHYFYE